jgi:hypothetical protein
MKQEQTMASKVKEKEAPGPIEIITIERETIQVFVWGMTPLIMNTVSFKAKNQLAFPPEKKNRAERAATLKHDPIAEYRDSAYVLSHDELPTRLYMPATSFKGAMMTMSLRIPGVFKTEIAPLVFIHGLDDEYPDYIPIYGIPQLRMDVVRNSDPNHTPDIHTRACLRHWACTFRITFARPLLTRTGIINLGASSGMFIGVGDYRQEKGKGSYGTFEYVADNDKRWAELVKTSGRRIQDAALETPVCYDLETERLYRSINEQITKRGREDQVTKAEKPSKAASAGATIIAAGRKRGNGQAGIAPV